MKKTLLLIFLWQAAFSQIINFKATGLLYLQDTDHSAFAFSTNTIEKENGSTDKIGSFLFPLSLESSSEFSEQHISNSVFNNHKAISVRSDNRLAYVLESRGALMQKDLKSNSSFANLTAGAYVSVVDISNLKSLKPEYRFPVGNNPTALALSKNDEYLAVSSEDPKDQIQVFEVNEFGKPIRIIQKPIAMSNGLVSDIAWHPSGDFLAYLKKDTKEIGLIKVLRDGPTQKIIRLELFGNTIKMEGLPSIMLYSQDGKYLYVLDKKNELSNSKSIDKGQVFVLKFSYEEGGKHFFVAKAEVEENPTGMSLHPDNNWLMVTNAKKSFDYPVNNSTNKSSISILKLQSDGNISSKSNFPILGVLPMSLTFDKTGENLAVSIFQLLNFGKSMGAIEFFKFDNTANGKLEKQDSHINIGKGVHYLKIIDNF